MAKTSVEQLRERVAALVTAATPPFEAVMAQETWDRLKAEHWAGLGQIGSGTLTGAQVIGVRVRIMPGTRGCILRHEHGVQFEPKTNATH
jgi:hypothetical protein